MRKEDKDWSLPTSLATLISLSPCPRAPYTPTSLYDFHVCQSHHVSCCCDFVQTALPLPEMHSCPLPPSPNPLSSLPSHGLGVISFGKPFLRKGPALLPLDPLPYSFSSSRYSCLSTVVFIIVLSYLLGK